MEDKITFKHWMASMDWDKHGGIISAMEALGKSRRTIERYLNGDIALSRETRLAMTALSEGLEPWDTKTEGLPAIHFSISLGRS